MINTPEEDSSPIRPTSQPAEMSPAERQKANREYAHQAATQSPFRTHTAKETEAQQEILQETGPYLTLGIQLALSIALFAGAGYWIDHAFGTSPLWLAIFAVFGAISSLAYFIVTVLRLSKKEETKGQ